MLKVIDVRQHADSISKGLVAVLNISALKSHARISAMLRDCEIWCLFFDAQMDAIHALRLNDQDQIPAYMEATLVDAISTTARLRYETIKSELTELVFAENKMAIN